MLRLLVTYSILSMLSFFQPHRVQHSWIDYYNLKGHLLKRIASPDGRSKKVLVLIDENDSLKAEGSIRNFEIIDCPGSEVIKNMVKAFKLTGDSNHEHGFYVGRKGTITPIEEGTHFQMPHKVLDRGKDYLKQRNDSSAYDVHTHEKFPPTGKEGDYGDASPSEGDMNPVNFYGRRQASVVLGYIPGTHHDISPGPPASLGKTYPPEFVQAIGFYNSKKRIGKPVEFERFILIANEINKK
jgi:hypothetical protein